ncbi:MAG: secretin N-terminal domain-containing protein, partial [Planctomycetota bacterium]
MRRLHTSFRGVVPVSAVWRLLSTVALGLALFTGLPTAAAEEPPAGGPGTKAAPRPGRVKPKPAVTPRPTRKPTPGKTEPPPTTQPAVIGEREEESPPAGPQEAAGTSEILDTSLDAAYEQMLKPAEERAYSISIQDGTYADLLDAFSRMSGLAILGDIPSGMVSYVSTEEMDYKTALSRMRKILFNHPENFYIWREGNSLQVFRITEAQRWMTRDRIYTNVQDFRDAALDEMEIVLVLYTPEKGRVADLEPLRDFMPDYVRIAPYRDTNAVTILALARDVTKYLELFAIFDQAVPDPRQFKPILMRHVLPSYAIEMLAQFMPPPQDGGAPPTPPPGRPSRGGQPAPSLASVKGHGIDLIPYDEIKTLFVRAMPDKIAEVEKYLAIIDVEHGPGNLPTIVPLEHVRVEQIMGALQPLYAGEPAAPSPAAAPPRKGRRSAPPAGVSANAIVTDAIEIHPHPANNTLIVFAGEEELIRLRMYVSLFDIPSQEKTVRVALTNVDAETLGALLEQILQMLGTTNPISVLVKPDPAGGGLILAGNPRDIELARGIVAELDQPSAGGLPGIHSYKCTHARPSALITLLSSLDQESAGTAPAAPPPAAGKKGQRATPRRRATGGTKYHGDDATGLLYVICTESEWDEDYLPLLAQLDLQAEPVTEITLVPVTYEKPDQIINAITQAFGPAQQGTAAVPTLLPHPRGILVLGGNQSTLERIRALAKELDVDPDIERRTFTLQFADPTEVKTVLESLVVQSPGPRPQRKTAKGQPPPTAAPASAGSQVQIVLSGRKDLIVQAPAQTMAEIAELITELDVDPLNLMVKVYDFPPGSDVREIAQTLSSFYPGSAAIPVGEPRGKGAEARRGLQVTKAGDVRFIPHVSALKILVSAPADLFADIEEKIAMLRPTEGVVVPAVNFYRVTHLDPQTMADTLQPLLEVKYQNLVDQGVIREKPAAPGKGAATKPVSVTPDPRGDRVIVVAPPQLSEEVQELIDGLDRPDQERVIKTVTLEKADPKEMVSAIQTLLAGRARPAGATPQPEGRRPERGRPTGPRRAQAGGGEEVTVVEAPGGSAVVLTGYAEDVAQVEQWIKELDDAAKGGREIKIYTPKNIDVEKFADAVMALLDSGGGKTPAAAKAPGKGEESMFEFTFQTGGPRRGKDIYLVTDTWAGTMLVSATPSKLREIDGLYAMYEGTPDGQKPIIEGTTQQPIDTYTLEHREDAYEAVYDLEAIIDALWADPANKPKVDYIPFTKILTVRGRPQDFDKVKDMITQYVDKPDEKKRHEEKGFSVVTVSGMTPSEMADILQNRIGPGRIKIEGVESIEDLVEEVKPGKAEEPKPAKSSETKPCVLPLSAARWMSPAALTDEAEEEPQPKELNSPSFNEKTKLKEEVLRSLGETAASQPAEAGTREKPPALAEEAGTEEPVLTIVPDDERGVLVIKGSIQDVADAKYLIEKILKELEEIPQAVDIRVFRVKYVDVSTAADILEAMFNAPRARALTPQQIQQMQLQQQQQQQRQRQQQQPPGQEPEEEKGKGKRPKEGEEPSASAAQQEPGQIRVYPDGRTHTIIVRAAPEQYPSIVKLLNTIDRKGTAADFRIYPLKRLNAAEVETKLKEMLGLDQRAVRQVARPQVPGGRQGVPVQNPQGQPIEFAMEMGGESLSLTGAERVTISSNPPTNTIMAMAPEKTLDLIGQLIDQLEEQEVPPWVTKTYELKHADAADVATQLEKTFAPKGGKDKAGEGFDPQDVNRPTFIADARMNSITVRALELDLPKIEPLIEQFDRESRDDKPKYIKLQYAKPSEVAKKLQEAFAGAAQGKSGKKSKIQVTGDDGSMQLIVIAPADTFADLQDMVAKLDVERTNLEFRIYPLTYARAAEVLRQLTELVRTLLTTGKGAGVDLGVFSAVADESTNSLVVAGEPVIFPIVEGVLKKIDIPPAEPVAIETRIYRLVSAQAEDVANTINRLFGQVRGKGGAEPARAEANASTNTVLVRGTKSQQEEIFNQIIKPLDEFAEQPINLKQEVIALQFAKADDVASYLNEWFRNQRSTVEQARIKGINPLDYTVSITPEVASNKLLVTANDKNL